MFMDEPASEAGGLPTQVFAVEDVTKRYTRRVALEKLSLSVRAGEVFGLVGANGGGKTTALRILAGILRPEQGRGQVLGFDLLCGTREIRQHVGYMSQRFSLYTDLSVFENLRFRAEVYGLERPRVAAEAAICEFGLCGVREQCGGTTLRRLGAPAATGSGSDPFAEINSPRRADRWSRCRVPAGGLAAHRPSRDSRRRRGSQHP
jgi:ABC-type transporter Mla maintaining outer membrane lipid asymmetry ATPase subunit MlaF